jgi:CRISPR-associated protein Cas2
VKVSNCPEHLYGYLSRFLFEVRSGLFVGSISSSVRDALWKSVESFIEDGDALMIYNSAASIQPSIKQTKSERWVPIDFDGVTLFGKVNKETLSPYKKF